MAFPGDHNESNSQSTIQQRILAQFQGDWVKRLNIEQMFMLISNVLPLEACLYYQVLPLFLEGNRLHLGMVTPNDTSALEYVRRIVSYLNYSLVPRAITYDALQVALTGYLNYTGNQPSGTKPRGTFSYGHYRHSAQTRLEQADQSARPTLILDNPEEYLEEFESTRMPVPVPPPPPMPASAALSSPPAFAEDATNTATNSATADSNPDDWQVEMTHLPPLPIETSQPQDPPLAPQSPTADPLQSIVSSLGALPPLISAIPPLDIPAEYLSSSVEVLATLPARTMLHELLARVLAGGIGRLYFECHPQSGRVLWSQDGILQSVLERLPLTTFTQLLTELKEIAELPATQISKPQHAEIERLYDRHRVLLRFRFMPGKHGEEATLQVLRGAALRFYQQQQLTKLKRDALGIAKQLQTKLNEIRDRAHNESGMAGARFDALPVLNQLLRNIEEQLDHLGDGDGNQG